MLLLKRFSKRSQQPAIYVNELPIDEVGSRACQENGRPNYICRCSPSTGRGSANDVPVQGVAGRAIRGIDGGGYITRSNSIDLYIMRRSEEHTSELQSLMRISYAVFCLKKTRET